jgi:hypothetical protein
MTKKFVVVAIAQGEARIWKTGLEPHTHPETVQAPIEDVFHHFRSARFHRGHDSDHLDPIYFESISDVLGTAEEILLVGHGKGKANSMLRLTQYLERKHPDQAKMVVDALDTDLENLSEGEILALAREWRASHSS